MILVHFSRLRSRFLNSTVELFKIMTFDFSCVNFLGMGGTFLILHTFQEQGETLKIKAHFMIMVHFFRDQGDF